jgi:hypothetical protein
MRVCRVLRIASLIVLACGQVRAQGAWSDADRQALRQAWLSCNFAETRRLQHKAWDSGHKEEIKAFQSRMFAQGPVTCPDVPVAKFNPYAGPASGSRRYEKPKQDCTAKKYFFGSTFAAMDGCW